MSYTAPIKDMLFSLEEIAGFDAISSLPGCEELSADLAGSILSEAGKFSASVLAPLNRVGDTQGVRYDDGNVTMPDGFVAAYQQLCAAGWNSLVPPAEYGGMNLPYVLATPVREMLKSANHGFCGSYGLTGGAVEALLAHGSDELKQVFLPRMVSGEWSGTMNLTESQAGSDLSAIRTRAEVQGDGTYRLFGQKIFITFGEHDLTENIIHLVLARLPDAPPGVRGISLFLVPKFLVNFADGTLGERNDVRCISIEHKMGIRSSPTCTMAYGEQDGAVGYLIGEPNQGLSYMFTMMNEARLAVGGEGIALAERAYQQAVGYARERVQGRDALTGALNVPIIHHPDVRRMLLTMRARVETARALSLMVAGMIDQAHRNPDADVRKSQLALVELLTPVVKACSTEMAIDVTSLNIQIHGGMGFIEETGAAQHYRDARITAIYEGTTGIQANDLIGRKVLREQGSTMHLLIGRMNRTAADLQQAGSPDLNAIGKRLEQAIGQLRAATEWVLATGTASMNLVLAGAVPFLHLTGTVCFGWLAGLAALAATRRLGEAGADRDFLDAKILTAQFYCAHELPHAESYARTVMAGDQSAMTMREAQF